MGEKFFQTLKKLLVAIIRLFADGIAEQRDRFTQSGP
jgi:hypothetical protein